MTSGLRGRGVGLLILAAISIYLLLSGGSEQGPDFDGDRGASSNAVEPRGSITVDVERVVDGDTIEVDINGSLDDVRYIGIDTPETVKPGEPVQCFGPQASERNHELVEGETVRLEFDRELRDVYGRLLAYVFVGDRFVNQELVGGGYARTLEIEPNTSRAGQLSEAEQQAGEAGLGLWGAC